MRPDRKKLDRFADCGLPCGQLASHRENTRHRAKEHFGLRGISVSGILKGVPGCVGNISNTHGCLVFAVTNSPALAESFSQESTAMSILPLVPHSNTHPLDLLLESQSKIEALTVLLHHAFTDTGSTSVNFQHPAISDGLKYLFEGIAEDIGYAVACLQKDAGGAA